MAVARRIVLVGALEAVLEANFRPAIPRCALIWIP